MHDIAAGVLLVTGSVVFLAGAALGVPRVFGEPDRARKLQLLEDNVRLWRLAQPLYALGPVLAAVGAGLLARSDDSALVRVLLLASGLVLLAGALCWSWTVYLRGRHYRQFALGTLPGWPFSAYVLLTITGLALLGAALWVGRPADWLGWLTLAADVVFLAGYVRYDDIPPFVFYLLLLVVGAVVL